ncbi:MAG: glycerate kinase [Burkholderiaceae bacterium]|nr:glycerate kinase [Microbacteriaceae bacterium]
MTGHRVVIAPDSFKGTATATEAARAIAAGWASVRPDDELRLMPMADGGEGSIEAFEIAVAGAVRMPVTVTGPDDRPVDTHWLLLPDGAGVVELASTSGITLLHPLLPATAHTVGFGEAIAAALDYGVGRLVLAIGGGSSADGGAGALAALGARFLDAGGAFVAPGNHGLGEIATVELAGLRALPPGGVVVLSDVTSPLLGPDGAASVFGPQKGVWHGDVPAFDARLAHFAGFVEAAVGWRDGAPAMRDTAGAGSAGGAGFGLLAWGASILAGSSAVGDIAGLSGAIATADVVITGEGRFDGQSDAGKVPSYVRGLAAGGARALLVAGAIEADSAGFAAAVSLTQLSGSADAAIRDTLHWLERAGATLAASPD